MAKKHGFRIDLHVHSVFSGESLADPRDILEAAIEKGLDGICVTEHQSLYASRPFDELKKDYPSLVVLRGVGFQPMQVTCSSTASTMRNGMTGEKTGLSMARN